MRKLSDLSAMRKSNARYIFCIYIRSRLYPKYYTEEIIQMKYESTTLVGVDLLQYGKVVIDYMRNRFYFFPFDSEIVDMGGAPKTWNVSILPANERFEITTVWDSMKDVVNFGDQVVDINGTDITKFPMSQPAVDSVMNAIKENVGYIVVLKDGQKKKIEIRRE